jgi:hypothetical protein
MREVSHDSEADLDELVEVAKVRVHEVRCLFRILGAQIRECQDST